VREALINSFCHKDYRVSQNNEVAIFKDRIEIYNPGTFPAGLTPQDFIERSERSVHRNPLLAQTLYYSKDIESFGTGLRRIMTLCQEADVKVEFQMLKMGFAVVFQRFNKEVDILGRVVKEKFIVPSGTINGTINGKSGTINSNEYSIHILEAILNNPAVTYNELAELLSIPRRTVSREMKKLQESGKIEREGARKNGCWIVKA
jgi:ATP-dependent DNA helicase RecG